MMTRRTKKFTYDPNKNSALEDCIKHAHERAQQAVKTWDAKGGDATAPPSLKDLNRLACQFLNAESIANAARDYPVSVVPMTTVDPAWAGYTKEQEAKESVAREAFCKAFIAWASTL
jgi:predicted TIM-barrel fold metal-dependent hydrolase